MYLIRMGVQKVAPVLGSAGGERLNHERPCSHVLTVGLLYEYSQSISDFWVCYNLLSLYHWLEHPRLLTHLEQGSKGERVVNFRSTNIQHLPSHEVHQVERVRVQRIDLVLDAIACGIAAPIS